jgi:hypothetical protein
MTMPHLGGRPLHLRRSAAPTEVGDDDDVRAPEGQVRESGRFEPASDFVDTIVGAGHRSSKASPTLPPTCPTSCWGPRL